MIVGINGVLTPTTHDISRFRHNRDVGDRVSVPVERIVDDTGRKTQGRTIRPAIIMQKHRHVAVTSAGTYSWIQMYYAERGRILE